jgi:serine/threonine-protein kinase
VYSAAVDREDDLIGTSIGAYEIERRIGAGGMGTVYLARQPEIGARVAIKVVNTGADADDDRDANDGDDSRARRLFAEARAVNLINHECIVNIIDMVQLDDGRPALVMEHLTGAPLDELLRDEPLPEDGAVEIVLDVLSAVGAAHQRGILHRDLKPANVFVTPRGRAKVLDFGVAKSLRGPNPMSTGAGLVLGTPAYMSPEQARGDEIDERGDLFSIGLIAYEALTGKRLFDGPTIARVVEQHERPFDPPRALRPEISAAIDDVIVTALEIAPERRYQSAPAMAAALRKAVGPRVNSSLLLTERVREKTAASASASASESAPAPGPEPTGETALERPAPREPIEPEPIEPAPDEDEDNDAPVSPWRSPWLILAGVFGLLTLAAMAINALFG